MRARARSRKSRTTAGASTASTIPTPDNPTRSYSKWGGFLDDIAAFDPDFFALTRREAEAMDPQQRILLQVAYEAAEDAAMPLQKLRERATGVYIGVSNTDYGLLQRFEYGVADIQAGTGTALSIVANRVSNVLDLHGPSMGVDTACSSSLVALDTACRALARRHYRRRPLRRRERADRSAHVPDLLPRAHAVAHGPHFGVRCRCRRLRARRRRRRGGAQAARRRAARRRPHLCHGRSDRRQPGRPHRQHHRAQPGRAEGHAARGASLSRHRAGRGRLCRGARHRHAARRSDRGGSDR